MKTRAVAMALALGGCDGAYAWHAPTRADLPVNASLQRIVARAAYLDARDVPAPWRRPDDPVAGQVFFLVSNEGSTCPATAADFTMAADNTEWLCVWRHAR